MPELRRRTELEDEAPPKAWLSSSCDDRQREGRRCCCREKWWPCWWRKTSTEKKGSSSNGRRDTGLTTMHCFNSKKGRMMVLWWSCWSGQVRWSCWWSVKVRLPQSTPGSADGEESCYCLKLGVDNSKGQQQWSIESEREEGGGSVVTWGGYGEAEGDCGEKWWWNRSLKRRKKNVNQGRRKRWSSWITN